MEISKSYYAVWTPRILGILRIVTGLLFLEHGTAKLLELVGGLLLIVGLFTRPTGFVLSGFMAVAYFMAHAPKGFLPILNQGELAVIYCFLFLYFAVAGAGAFSIDAGRGKA